MKSQNFITWLFKKGLEIVGGSNPTDFVLLFFTLEINIYLKQVRVILC